MDSLVKSKSLIDIFKKDDLDCSWVTIQIGWNLGLLSVEEVHTFAFDFSENNPDLINKYISEIIFSTDRREVDSILEKIVSSLGLEIPTMHSSLWSRERHKWRYGMLKDLVDKTQNAEELLTKVEGVYADFGYPEDMKSFIYYMPADEEVSDLNLEDARRILVKRLKNFLTEEKIKLTKLGPLQKNNN
jgi:hypothetical protein